MVTTLALVTAVALVTVLDQSLADGGRGDDAGGGSRGRGQSLPGQELAPDQTVVARWQTRRRCWLAVWLKKCKRLH